VEITRFNEASRRGVGLVFALELSASSAALWEPPLVRSSIRISAENAKYAPRWFYCSSSPPGETRGRLNRRPLVVPVLSRRGQIRVGSDRGSLPQESLMCVR
jgi:hypothetical protein